MNVKILSVKNHDSKVSTALLLLRLVAGVAFILHGWGKIQTPLTWMGPGTVPGFLQLLAAVSEFGGGIAIILGLLTPLACLGNIFTMMGAIYFHAIVRGDPFVSKGGGSYELATVYLVIFILLLISGPGAYSLDRVFFGDKHLKN